MESPAVTFPSRPELKNLLAAIRGKPQEYAIKLGLLKSLKRARYAPEPLGHYGLNKANYTHFTSPIRRYSDLVVHRALAQLLGLTKRGPDSSALPSISEHLSTTERIAADAEKDSVKLKKLEYFQQQAAARHAGEAFLARILEVRNYGLLIELPRILDDRTHSCFLAGWRLLRSRRAAGEACRPALPPSLSGRRRNPSSRRTGGPFQAAGRLSSRIKSRDFVKWIKI